jgi:hypothetical protein
MSAAVITTELLAFKMFKPFNRYAPFKALPA